MDLPMRSSTVHADVNKPVEPETLCYPPIVPVAVELSPAPDPPKESTSTILGNCMVRKMLKHCTVDAECIKSDLYSERVGK